MPLLKLSDRALRALKAPDPSGKQQFYWDTMQTGFGVLVSGKSDVKSYVAKGQLNGQSVLKTLGKVGVLELAEARQAAREISRDLGAGIDPRRKKTAQATLGATLTAYLEAHDLALRTKASHADLVARYFADWQDLSLQNITRDMVETRHRSIAEDVEAKRKGHSGKATANAAMRTLRAIYNYAADRDHTLPANPVRLRRQWHKVRPRERVITAGQMPAFYKAVTELASPIGRDYLLLVLFTGLRRREAASLRWSDVDFPGRTLSIPAERNKAGRKLDLPLTDFVHDLLAKRRAIGKTEFVFHAASRSGHLEMPRYFLEQVAKASGVKVSVHDLRRTYITIAESCDISPIALKTLVNHSQGGTSPATMSGWSSSGCASRRSG